MRHILTNLGLLGGAAIGVFTLGQVIITSPAFNTELREGNAFGDVTLLLGRDMYNRPAYLYQQAASFVRADLFTLGTGEIEGEAVVASPEEAEARARQAVALAQESLSMDPGNAGAWMVLAWGHLMTGNADETRAAMAVSRQIAPYDFILSEERIAVSLTLFDPAFYVAEDVPILTEDEAAGLVADFEALWLHQTNLYKAYSEQAAQLKLPVFEAPNPG